MHFTIDQQDATTIFRLKEAKLDSANSSALKAEFLILAQPNVETLIVDLTDVEYIDSAGLSALLLAERQQSAHGGDVRLVGANDSVKSLLRLTQLDRVFPLFATTEEALTAEILDGEAMSSSKSTGDMPKRAGAIAAGGSLGAAALAAIMMGHSDDPDMLLADDEDFEDDDEFDDELDDEEDFDDELDDEEEDDEEEPDAVAEDTDPKVDEDPDPAVIEEDIDAEDFDDEFDDEDDDDFEEEDDLL